VSASLRGGFQDDALRRTLAQRCVAMLRLSEVHTSVVAPLCVRLSRRSCALHGVVRGFQVEVPQSRRAFDEDVILSGSCVSAVAGRVVQARSNLEWRTVADASCSVRAVAGAGFFDSDGDLVAVFVGFGSTLAPAALHSRWSFEHRRIAPDDAKDILIHDAHMARLHNDALAGAAGSRTQLVADRVVFDDVVISAIETARALDELRWAGGSAAAQPASAAAGGAGAAFRAMPAPSAAAMALSQTLPRLLRASIQPETWCLMHAIEAASRRAEVQAGACRVLTL
jgi:hypothetical protein